MAFLTIEELKTVATREVIDLITNSDDSIVEEIINESIDLMKSYLFKYFDVDAIFSAEGEDRKRIVLKYLKDIVIHEVYQRRTRTLNEVAKERYDEALNWLEQIAKGNIAPDLPLKEIDKDGDGKPDGANSWMKLGSRRNKANHW